MQVLRSKDEIEKARTVLKSMGASSLDGVLPQFLRRLGLSNRILFIDKAKSWDVLKTVEFLNSKVLKTDAVLDIGSYASEILVCLKKAGYTQLVGVDLNPDVQRMPFNDQIRYEVSDFMKTPFEDASFQAVTSISVIEHGLDTQALFSEVSRLLKPGGYFIASFDYWPEKISTDGIKFFGMEWTIFSKEEVNTLCGVAAKYDLAPMGVLNPPVDERTVHCANKDYTFAWLVFQKA